MTKNTLVDNIRRIRKATGVTQAEAARAIGVGRVSYIKREKEEIEFKIGELEKFAKLVGATLDDIVNIDLSPERVEEIGVAYREIHESERAGESSVKLFQQKEIRSVWVEEEEEWYFSVVDVVGVLTESPNPRRYWSDLKVRLKDEGAEHQLYGNCVQLMFRSASDGKLYASDAANTEQLLRIIQSIPSKKAEPFKQWLARVGAERINEDIDPELAIHRAAETYQKKGYDEGWIRQRLLSIKIRGELTDEWRARGVSGGTAFAILTDEISKAWSGMTTKEYKDFKNLKKENLRDNMTDVELVLSMLAEASTRDLSRVKRPETFAENQEVAREGGGVAGVARRALEDKMGRPAISPENAKNQRRLGTV